MTTRAWYQETWPWVLIAIPFSAVLFGIVMVTTALNHPDDLVVDDYYKEGKGINRSLERDRLARELGINASWERGQMGFQVSGATDAAVYLNIYHVTDQQLDRQIILTPDDSNFYGVEGEELAGFLSAPGVWYLELQGAEQNWRLRKRVVAPASQVVME